MRRRILIPGPVLIGFSELFDRAHGDPKTERPYPKVTPSRMGSVLLPFACPHCGEVRSEVVDPRRREHYYDRDRDFGWCPACRKRYVIDFKGTPLVASISAGAVAAPALVERNGTTKALDVPDDGIDALGAL